MANSNPWKARLEKTRKRLQEMTTGDIEAAQKALHMVLLDGLSRIEQQPGDQEFCRLASAITSAAREYRALIEVGEIEERIQQLEASHGTTRAHRYN